MAIGQHGVSGDLVAGLIDARETPASDRFDEELAAGVERGEITPDAARRLKLWQRAAVSELADHIRAVLPTALSALAAARDEATRRVKEREDAAEAAAVVAEPAIPAHPDAPAPVEPHDTPEPASDTTPPAPSSLETRPPRQLVADLVATRTPAHHDHS
jgi:hypothetical protein